MTNVEPRRAKVLWWDPERVHVLCPWCERSHCHQFSKPYHNQLGEAPCRPSHSGTATYSIDYPIDPANVGYEIDKENCRYMTKLGLEHQKDLLSDAYMEDRRWGFRKEIEKRQTWSATMEKSLVGKDAKEKKTMGEDATIRLDDTICFRMIQGDLEFVKNFLESSSDAAPFLHGVYSELHSKQSAPESGGIGFDQFPYGTTALHMAARGQYPEIVRLLATKGANIDAQDISGYTPLMEAAFWGRLENVQILLDRGANAMLKCIHDGRSKTAEELAENTRSNAWIRRRRVGGPTCESLVNDDTYARDCDRDDIRHLLRGRMFKDPTVPAHLALQGFAFRKEKEVPGLLSFTTYYSLFDEWKAAAVLHRGRNLPDVSAMSGWAHDDESDKPFISGKEWTAKVLNLSRRFDFQLQPSDYDGDKVGRYEASHAEKQLFAYLIDRHWFIKDEMILPDQMDELAESAANLDIQDSDEARSRQRERVRKEKLGKLYDIRPADRLKEAAIMANKPICEECERFIQGVRPSELDLRAHGYRTID